MDASVAAPAKQKETLPISVPELVGLVAAMMGLNAFSIDIILPALPDIGAAFGLVSENAPQLIITAYIFGFGVATIAYGPLSDAFGRRNVLLVSMIAFLGFTVLCAFAPSFWVLLAARTLQGVAAASTRVMALAIVRDLVHGRRMAEIMSIAMTVFMISPIIAPGAGQLLLFVVDWRLIFIALLFGAAGVTWWIWARLPETLAPEDRQAFRLGNAARNYVIACSNRISLGYTIASGFVFGSLFAFIATSEQVFAQHYSLGAAFPLAFAGVAGGMALASFANARLVGRLGMRRLSHVALTVYTLTFAGMVVIALLGIDTFWTFFLPYFVAMFCFGMIGANFNTLAMEPAGHYAGTMAAALGAYGSIAGAVFGTLIGLSYDGTVTPIVVGNLLLGIAAVATVLVTERGRLFHSSEADE